MLGILTAINKQPQMSSLISNSRAKPNPSAIYNPNTFLVFASTLYSYLPHHIQVTVTSAQPLQQSFQLPPDFHHCTFQSKTHTPATWPQKLLLLGLLPTSRLPLPTSCLPAFDTTPSYHMLVSVLKRTQVLSGLRSFSHFTAAPFSWPTSPQSLSGSFLSFGLKRQLLRPSLPNPIKVGPPPHHYSPSHQTLCLHQRTYHICNYVCLLICHRCLSLTSIRMARSKSLLILYT